MDKKLPAEPLMDAETDEVPGYQFTNPDPYAKCAPLPEDHIQHRTRFDEDGHIIVKNPSACWFPDLTVQREIDGTIYSVTGSYDGTETLDEKLKRIMEQDAKNSEEANDKWRFICYNGNTQFCADSCPVKGGYRNVTGN